VSVDSDFGGEAYQLCSRKKLSAPVAAARVDADLGVLLNLIRFIPPSRKQKFGGYSYVPKKGD
jgi:hypothetical protein